MGPRAFMDRTIHASLEAQSRTCAGVSISSDVPAAPMRDETAVREMVERGDGMAVTIGSFCGHQADACDDELLGRRRGEKARPTKGSPHPTTHPSQPHPPLSV